MSGEHGFTEEIEVTDAMRIEFDVSRVMAVLERRLGGVSTRSSSEIMRLLDQRDNDNEMLRRILVLPERGHRLAVLTEVFRHICQSDKPEDDKDEQLKELFSLAVYRFMTSDNMVELDACALTAIMHVASDIDITNDAARLLISSLDEPSQSKLLKLVQSFYGEFSQVFSNFIGLTPSSGLKQFVVDELKWAVSDEHQHEILRNLLVLRPFSIDKIDDIVSAVFKFEREALLLDGEGRSSSMPSAGAGSSAAGGNLQGGLVKYLIQYVDSSRRDEVLDIVKFHEAMVKSVYELKSSPSLDAGFIDFYEVFKEAIGSLPEAVQSKYAAKLEELIPAYERSLQKIAAIQEAIHTPMPTSTAPARSVSLACGVTLIENHFPVSPKGAPTLLEPRQASSETAFRNNSHSVGSASPTTPFAAASAESCPYFKKYQARRAAREAQKAPSTPS